MKLIKEKSKTPYTLAIDLNNEKTGRYSTKRGEFTGYVIDGGGTITKILTGDLRNRAKSEELLSAISASSPAGSSAKEGSDAKAGSETKAGSATKASAGSASNGSGSK